MSWQQLLASHRVYTHTTSGIELEGLRAIIARDLKDAHVSDLSTDRQFATAYIAVLQLAKMAVACARYRVVGAGHYITILEAILGADLRKSSRNVLRRFDPFLHIIATRLSVIMAPALLYIVR